MPLAPSTRLQHPKTPPPPKKNPAQPGGCCPPSCSASAPSSSSSSAPGHPAATSGQGTVLGRGQGWSLVVTLFFAHHQPLLPILAGSPLSLVAGGCRRTPVPAVTPVSPTLLCCRFRAGNRDPHVWGSLQPPCAAGHFGGAGALASPAATPGETEARSRVAGVPGLGAPTPALAKQKTSEEECGGNGCTGPAARSLSPSTMVERASWHRRHRIRSFPACTHKPRDP